MGKKRKQQGHLAREGPVAIIGVALLAYGLTGLILGGSSQAGSRVVAPAEGTTPESRRPRAVSATGEWVGPSAVAAQLWSGTNSNRSRSDRSRDEQFT